MPEDARERLFERFYRVETITGAEGTGLGLSIVRETVESLGGRAWAEFPEEDGGAKFKIALPIEREPDDESSTPTSEESAENGAARN